MPIKRVEDAIHAFHALYTKDSSYILNIVGVGDLEYTKSLKVLVSELSMEDSVIFY
jgi:glycosyltransferase involved in cell wall biosynthesis